MPKIYIVQAEHPAVPGRPISAHATMVGALARALELVNIIREAVELPQIAKLADEAALDAALAQVATASDYAFDPEGDEGDFDVWITSLDLQGDAEAVAVPRTVLADLLKLAATAPAYATSGQQWAVRAVWDARGLEGATAAPEASAPATRHFAHTEESCPSKHWNDGDDVCADCGADLQGA
jgi:hypothetical protein